MPGEPQRGQFPRPVGDGVVLKDVPAEFPVGQACRGSKECFGTFDSESEVAEPTVAELEELVRRQNDLLSS